MIILEKGENNMKKFDTPMMEVESLEIADVITTSNCGEDFELPE